MCPFVFTLLLLILETDETFTTKQKKPTESVVPSGKYFINIVMGVVCSMLGSITERPVVPTYHRQLG